MAAHLVDLDGLCVASEGPLEVPLSPCNKGRHVPADVTGWVQAGAFLDELKTLGLLAHVVCDDALHASCFCGRAFTLTVRQMA